MSLPQQIGQYAAGKLSRRLSRSMPVVGGAIALLALGRAIRRKGVLGGSLDTVLDVIPFVGAVKNLAEAARGRDFIRDIRA
jgi:hypothetical protein